MPQVVITAYQPVTPIGCSEHDILLNLQKRNIPFVFSEHEEGLVVAPVTNFNVRNIVGRNKNIRYLNRGGQLALAAAYSVIKKSFLSDEALADCGLVLGSGPNFDLESELIFNDDGVIMWESMPALWMLRFLPNSTASVIANILQLHGENKTINTACASGLQAVGEGYRLIKNGMSRCVLCGAGDSRLSTGGLKAYSMAQALASSKNPDNAIRPFDVTRNGFVPGEGSAFFLLEEYEHARKRGADIICEVSGFATSIDGYNMTAPHPEGKWAEQAVNSALDDALLSSDNIDLISAHGTGTQLNDAMEVSLIERIYSDSQPTVIGLKSWMGHLAAACGAAELAVVLGCMNNNYFPEIRNLKKPCSDNVSFLLQGQLFSPKTVLLQSFGFGGQNSVLIIKQV